MVCVAFLLCRGSHQAGAVTPRFRPKLQHIGSEAGKFRSVQDFKQKYPTWAALLRNASKPCLNCGKPCAVTEEACSRCAGPLGEVDHSSTNVLMSMALGIHDHPISLRLENRGIVVIDAVTAVSPVHLIAFPTGHLIPDFLHYLLDPEKGLKLHDEMRVAILKVAEDVFPDVITNLCPKGHWSREDLLSCALIGYNLPPSQDHVHLKYMMAPLLPLQHHRLQEGRLMKRGRFYPHSYVRQVLECELRSPREGGWNEAALTTDVVVEHFAQTHGISYNEHYDQHIRQFLNQTLLAWPSGQFRSAADNREKVLDDDREKLQNYGQPWVGGRPYLTFLTKPTAPDEIQDWSLGDPAARC